MSKPKYGTHPLVMSVKFQEEVSDGETPQTDLVHEETLDLRNGGGEKPTVAVQEDNADEGLLEEEIVSVLSEVIHPTKVEKVEEIDEEEDSSDLSLRSDNIQNIGEK